MKILNFVMDEDTIDLLAEHFCNTPRQMILAWDDDAEGGPEAITLEGADPKHLDGAAHCAAASLLGYAEEASLALHSHKVRLEYVGNGTNDKSAVVDVLRPWAASVSETCPIGVRVEHYGDRRFVTFRSLEHVPCLSTRIQGKRIPAIFTLEIEVTKDGCKIGPNTYIDYAEC